MNARSVVEMYGLPEISKMNRRVKPMPEDPWSRLSSYHGTPERGIVLHSASQRSTRFIPAGKGAVEFLAAYKQAKTDQQRNAAIEQYFVEAQEVKDVDGGVIVDELLQS